MKILVIGASGMLGHAVFDLFSGDSSHSVFGTLRHARAKAFFAPQLRENLLTGVDVHDLDGLTQVLGKVVPDVVINCVGLIKQLADADDPLVALPINALFPHRLTALCRLSGARLVHISTDCVFQGTKGGYKEADVSDAVDLYGKSKFMGEIYDTSHVITLRTSIIGHELNTSNALIDWFLSQPDTVKGYAKAIFSGLPTVELARVIRDFVLPRPELSGLYHVSAEPISKLELLKLVAEEYGRSTSIVSDETVKIDRSLDSSKFAAATGYRAPAWPELIQTMRQTYTPN